MNHFEKFDDELAKGLVFSLRVVRFGLYSSLVLVFGLLPGIFGFYYFCDLPFYESWFNALSILAGIGLIVDVSNSTIVLFAASYSLFSNTLFLIAVGILLTPVIHRILHIWHLSR